ncbi:hypothetical protein ADL12_16825 [Streptomyces regalis]|uniref:Uncharacterized protein n=1 Tax=Streptomyces regalis TaxID=68262 RepID=A0A0X3V0G2_9ACTN|nr:hypothetical protein ADL12_16825 [Streptomyces regalis]
MRGGAGGVGPGVGVRREQGVVLLPAGQQQTHSPTLEFARAGGPPWQVEAGEQRQVGLFGDQDPALGVQDVAGEFGAAAGGVDAGDGGAGEGRRAQPQGVFRGVVEQHPDVRAGRHQVGQQGCPGRGARRHLVMGKRPPFAPQPRTVVAPSAGDEFRDRTPVGLHGGAR